MAKEKLPSVVKIKEYLSSAKQRVTSIKSVEDLKNGLASIYQNVKQKISTV